MTKEQQVKILRKQKENKIKEDDLLPILQPGEESKPILDEYIRTAHLSRGEVLTTTLKQWSSNFQINKLMTK